MPRAARATFRTIAMLVATLCALTLLPRVATADPSQSTLAAKRELARLNDEVSNATEDYDAAALALDAARRDAARAQARVEAKQRAVLSLQEGIGGLVSAAYRGNGGVDPLLQLMTTATPETFLDRAGTLDAVSRNQASQMRGLRAARRALAQDQALAREKVAAADRIADGMARTKDRIEKAIARQKVLVAKLETEDARRERLAREAAARRAAQLAAAREAARRKALIAAAARASRSRSASLYTGPASGRASVAVAEAYRQLGKPYRWAAAGPDEFDCSGLTMWVWAKAGVSLPHSSRAQFNEGHHVSQNELQPGDLVFFGSPIHHVGIYVGNGNMINAPETGDVVKVAPAFRSDYVGAVRL